MAIVNTDFNSNSISFNSRRSAPGTVVDFKRSRSFAAKAAERASTESNADAAKSFITNADMASEVALFSRLQVISRAGGYFNLRSSKSGASIINVNSPRFDRTF
ncbi:MAG: hypothetical protein WCX65_19270 [bacterium]